jgi:hypothetical protein
MRKETSIYLIRPSERKDEAFLFLALSSSEGARGNIFLKEWNPSQWRKNTQ